MVKRLPYLQLLLPASYTCPLYSCIRHLRTTSVPLLRAVDIAGESERLDTDSRLKSAALATPAKRITTQALNASGQSYLAGCALAACGRLDCGGGREK